MKTKLNRSLLALALVAVAAATSSCGSSNSKSSNDSSMPGMGGMEHSRQGTSTSADAGDVDRAFVAQMIPHHEMAVEMAKTAEGLSDHQEVNQLAGSIVSTQEKEITELKSIASQLKVTPGAMPSGSGMHDDMMAGDAKTLGLSMNEMGMSMRMDDLMSAKPFDRAFIDMMIPHHQGAIRMARAELDKGTNPQLKQIATDIIAAQTKEIGQMNSWRTKWYGSASPAGGVPAT